MVVTEHEIAFGHETGGLVGTSTPDLSVSEDTFSIGLAFSEDAGTTAKNGTTIIDHEPVISDLGSGFSARGGRTILGLDVRWHGHHQEGSKRCKEMCA